MKHLHTMNDLETKDVFSLINRANEFKNGLVKSYNFEKNIASIFLEPSTRTSMSFELACKKLKVNVVNFNATNSSLDKGETFLETISTINCYDLDALIIRSNIENYFNLLNIKTPIINAGDGCLNHPTQSLLDLMTIYNEFNCFEGLKVLIIGDIVHSRVAHSNYEIMTKLNMQVDFCAPSNMQGEVGNYVEITNINNYDVVMLLRIQTERHNERGEYSNYNTSYGLNKERLKQLKEDAIIMHPGPYNMGVELTSDVLVDKRCKINEQVNNGLYMRMAVIDEICS